MTKHVRLQEWDANIGPCLQAILSNARWVKKHAERVTYAANLMRSRPDFETMAEGQLIDTQRELEIASQAIKNARGRFKVLEAAS